LIDAAPEFEAIAGDKTAVRLARITKKTPTKQVALLAPMLHFTDTFAT
jgi:hypothetical protein